MTESEAKTKWCPMVRQGDMNSPTGINRGYRQDFNCIGSACMMWRTFQQNGKEGYCGLAGKP